MDVKTYYLLIKEDGKLPRDGMPCMKLGMAHAAARILPGIHPFTPLKEVLVTGLGALTRESKQDARRVQPRGFFIAFHIVNLYCLNCS